MIIGYGWGPHIDGILLKAAEVKAKFFIVDVAGIQVMDKRKGQDQIAQRLWDALAPQIIGAHVVRSLQGSGLMWIRTCGTPELLAN